MVQINYNSGRRRLRYQQTNSLLTVVQKGMVALMALALFLTIVFNLISGDKNDTAVLSSTSTTESMFTEYQDHKREHRRMPRTIPTNTRQTTTATEESSQRIQSDSSSKQQPGLLPIFVFSLPNHDNLAVTRYFQCLGFQVPIIGDASQATPKLTMGRYWRDFQAEWDVYREPIGKCWGKAVTSGNSIDDKCGTFDVYLDTQYVEAPRVSGRAHNKKPAQCFDLVMYEGGLEALAAHHPSAIVLNFVRTSPQTWFESLPKDYHRMWKEWCNPLHPQQPFPKEYTEEAYVSFYNNYQQRLRQFAQQHPNWNYVEVNLDDSPQSIEATLDHHIVEQLSETFTEEQEQCWQQSTSGILPTLPTSPKVPEVPPDQPLPNNLQLPMLVTALPKSGTTTLHDFFSCALGTWQTAHQWVTNLTHVPPRAVPVGELFHENILQGKPMFEAAGHARIFSDIGILRWKSGKIPNLCFYPSLHLDALQKFYDAAPYGSIVHLVRNATAWYKSAQKWKGQGGLTQQWSRIKCQGFPGVSATQQEWEDFYTHHNQVIRQFVQDHPTLHYLEIPLAEDTGKLLEAAYGFPAQCWGHANQKAELEKMREQKKLKKKQA